MVMAFMSEKFSFYWHYATHGFYFRKIGYEEEFGMKNTRNYHDFDVLL